MLFVKKCVWGGGGRGEMVVRRGFCVLRQVEKTINTGTSIPKLNHSQDAYGSFRKSVNFGGNHSTHYKGGSHALCVFLLNKSGFEQVTGYPMEKRR